MTNVLFVDDDTLFADATAEILRARGCSVTTASSLLDAKALGPGRFDWVVADHFLPDGSGLDLASDVDRTRTRVVLVSASPPLEAALEALRLGVARFLTKPLDFEALLEVLRPWQPPGAARAQALPSVESRARLLDALARSMSPVLITGETGTGKGHLARAIHDRGGAGRPFVAMNCAAIPASLAEAELFGVERGAYTGAEPRPGLLEMADGGTLFLDEIGDLAPTVQTKLLCFLDDGTSRRIGGTRWKRLGVRILAATHRDLGALVAEGAFRVDLYHRLDVARVELRSLRDRPEDLEPLVAGVLAELSRRDGRRYALAPGEMGRLCGHRWTGNIRELRNCIERATLADAPDRLAPSQTLASRPAGARAPMDAPAPAARMAPLAVVERAHVMSVLAACQNNRSRAAEVLGIGLSTLRRKLREWSDPGSAGSSSMDET